MAMRRTKQTRAIVLMAVLAAAVCGGAAGDAEGEPNCAGEEKTTWLSYDQALARGRERDLPIVLLFYKDHCRQCELLKEKGFNRPDLACYVNHRLAPSAVNGDQDRELRDKFNVATAPTVWFLTPAGEKIYYFVVYVKPERLVLILHYIGDRAYETQTFDQYLKDQQAP
jgi:thioredoxin-related protein